MLICVEGGVVVAAVTVVSVATTVTSGGRAPTTGAGDVTYATSVRGSVTNGVLHFRILTGDSDRTSRGIGGRIHSTMKTCVRPCLLRYRGVRRAETAMGSRVSRVVTMSGRALTTGNFACNTSTRLARASFPRGACKSCAFPRKGCRTLRVALNSKTNRG